MVHMLNIRCFNPSCREIFQGNKRSKFCSLDCKKHYFNFPFEEHTLAQKKKILKSKITSCQICGLENKNVLEVDHKIPSYKGGTDNFNNLQIICSNCHTLKHKLED